MEWAVCPRAWDWDRDSKWDEGERQKANGDNEEGSAGGGWALHIIYTLGQGGGGWRITIDADFFLQQRQRKWQLDEAAEQNSKRWSGLLFHAHGTGTGTANATKANGRRQMATMRRRVGDFSKFRLSRNMNFY